MVEGYGLHIPIVLVALTNHRSVHALLMVPDGSPKRHPVQIATNMANTKPADSPVFCNDSRLARTVTFMIRPMLFPTLESLVSTDGFFGILHPRQPRQHHSYPHSVWFPSQSTTSLDTPLTGTPIFFITPSFNALMKVVLAELFIFGR